MKISQRILSLVLTLLVFAGSFSIAVFAAEDTVYGIGFVTSTTLRLRKEPNTTAAVLDTASKNECVVLLSKSDQWYKVNYNLQVGYMHENYLQTSQRENAELGIGKITGQSVNLRVGPSTSHAVAAISSKHDTCSIIGLNDGWYKVLYKDKTCYIRSDYVDLTEIPYENDGAAHSPKYFRLGKSIKNTALESLIPSVTDAPSDIVKVTGDQIIVEAQKYLGTRYVNGGASPSGFDCSGLVYYVLTQLGYSSYRTPADQIKHGSEVSKEQLKPGDLVFFSGTGASGISHVGIYAGGGQFLHAPNSRSTVSFSSLTSGYWAEHYHSGRRIG